MDCSSSSISMSFDVSCCRVLGRVSSTRGAIANGLDCDAELRRRNLPSWTEETDAAESRRLPLFIGLSREVCLSIPSFTM